MRAFLLGIIFIGSVLAPAGAALAQSKSTIPEFNSLCWREDKCYDVRTKILANGRPFDSLNDAEKALIKSGFVEQDPCTGGKSGEKWGKCLPAATAKTMIAFGGKREFANIGEFIQTNYTYVITLAAVLSVIMIIVAGFQWVMSGGNSEAISSAKNRISGAMIGLFIAYSSYFILTTINPNLVNLSLPNTWMIRPQAMVPAFCDAAPTSTMMAEASPMYEQHKKIDFTKELKYRKYEEIKKEDPRNFGCGTRFAIKDGGESTCFGSYCIPGEVCLNFASEKVLPYQCGKGNITGVISPSKLLDVGCGEDMVGRYTWEVSEITDPNEHEIWVVCNSGKSYEVPSNAATYDVGSKGQQYVSLASKTDIDAAMRRCGQNNVEGFVMTFEMNEECSIIDEDHVIGKCPATGANCEAGKAVDLGPWDFFTIGKNTGEAPAKLKNLIKNLRLKRYFITENELRASFQMDMDASKVLNVNGSEDNQVYNKLGL